MRKIKYLILLVICTFLLTNNVFAASDYYEHIWTNSYEENATMIYYDDTITNDVIKIDGGYLTVGYSHDDGYGDKPRIHLLDENGKLTKEVELDSSIVTKLKRVYKIDDYYYALGVRQSYLTVIVLDSNFKYVEHIEENVGGYLESFEFFVEYEDGYFYVVQPYDYVEYSEEGHVIVDNYYAKVSLDLDEFVAGKFSEAPF